MNYSDNKYSKGGLPIGIIVFTRSCFIKKELNKTLIESGEFKNYYRFDLGDFYFFNGRFEHNLTYKIQQKNNHKIVYAYKDSLSDAMILKPRFFTSPDNSTILIMVEVAAEYSWSQEIILLKEGTIQKVGYLNYAVEKGNGESISEYCNIMCENGKLIMTFDDVPLVNWSNESKNINGKDLKYEISPNGIKRIE